MLQRADFLAEQGWSSGAVSGSVPARNSRGRRCAIGKRRRPATLLPKLAGYRPAQMASAAGIHRRMPASGATRCSMTDGIQPGAVEAGD